MAVTGGIKFFDLNLADSKTGTTATASSGDPAAPFILDRNNYTYWRSVGSDDLTQEQIDVDFPASTTFSRLFLIGHNFKDISVVRKVGPLTFPFTNVIGVNGVSKSGISETNETRNTSYYEFSETTGDGVRITCQTTQAPNEEKFLNSLVLGSELGTLQGYPIIRDATKDKKLRKSILLNGRSFVSKSLEVFRFSIDFKNYASDFTDDTGLIYELFDRDDNFYTWLCGGRAEEPWFCDTLRGWRLEDLILTQTTNIFKDSYRKNIYTSATNLKLNLEEAG